jgi:hypothetical protein
VAAVLGIQGVRDYDERGEEKKVKIIYAEACKISRSTRQMLHK